jgi:5-methylcytosine-specific restriction endonuclease McrA
MSPGRAPHVCADCTRLVPAGAGPRCEEHARQPWAGKTFDKRRADTTEHRRLKAQALQRAGYRCQIADIGCLGAAELELDRVDHTLAYSLENTQIACRVCHSRKTGREGRAAQLGQDAPGEPTPAAPRPVAPPRPGRGRRRRTSYDGVSVPRPIWVSGPPSADGQEGHEGHEGSRW